MNEPRSTLSVRLSAGERSALEEIRVTYHLETLGQAVRYLIDRAQEFDRLARASENRNKKNRKKETK